MSSSRRRANTDSGMLAKLMAQENLNVINDPNITMSKLDVKNRVLSMPILKEMSGTVYEGFTSKEVGKALYSEQEQFSRQRQNLENQQQGMGAILDILEEARTQNLVEQKFPGTVGVNSRFYSEMWHKDMFKVRDRSMDELHFMDRLNLERKVGHIARPDFNEAEQAFVDRASQIKTFDESMSLSQDILNYLYEPEPPKPEDENNDGDDDQNNDQDQNGDNGGGGSSGSGEDENQEQDGEGNSQGQSSGMPEGEGEGEPNGTTQQPSGGGTGEGGRMPAEKMPPKIETNSNFDESFAENEVDESQQGSQTMFVSEQKNPDSCVELLKDTLKRWKQTTKNDDVNTNLVIDTYYERFIEETKPTIQYMKKQFDQLKQADAHKRTRTAKSGKLDTRKLMFYKTTEDIFKASKRVKDGKSHGLFMMMDMSGSMDGSRLFATIRQTLLMVLFCRAINIPFNVYSFTTGSYGNGRGDVKMDVNPVLPTLTYSTRDVKLVEYLHSSMSKADFKYAFRCLLREALLNNYPASMSKVGNKRDFRYNNERLEYMGGTPTTEALNVMSGQMLKFKEANKIEVLNTILLTDGDCSSVTFSNIGYASSVAVNGSVVVDNKTKKQFPIKNYDKGRFNKTMNSIMCDIVKARTGCNLISIRIGCQRSSGYSLDDVTSGLSKVESKKIRSTFKSKGSVSIPYKGVDKFIISLDNDIVTESDISSDGNIKQQFNDVATKKKNSKILANLILESIVAKLS